MASVFMTGASGYIGSRLVPQLIARGHTVRALVRPDSRGRLSSTGAAEIIGNALDRTTFAHAVAPSDTFIQLVGVAHPSPAKREQFRTVDLVSVRESVASAKDAGVKHFIYLSVAQPAPVMRDYVAVRAEGERMIRESGMAATFVRPWYVLGPGHRWPYLILPLYWLMWPSATARRLYPVKLGGVVRAIAEAVAQPPEGVRIFEGAELRR